MWFYENNEAVSIYRVILYYEEKLFKHKCITQKKATIQFVYLLLIY